jgi:hypothetical protein
MKKNFLLKLNTITTILSLLILVVSPLLTVQVVQAAGPDLNVLGYAWSYHPSEQAGDFLQASTVSAVTGLNPLGTQGFGWISMTGENPDAGDGAYEVTLNPTTGKFAGYAWSELGGYVNFAPTGPFPTAAGTTAQSAYVDPGCLADATRTCPVKGWVRFTEGTTGNSSWDGWVNMEIFNNSAAVARYSFPLSAPGSGVKLLPKSNGFRNMAGYAWGDDLAGIIGFSKAKIEIIEVGCTDPTASNYNENATSPDGSCIYVLLCPDGSVAPNEDMDQCEDPKCTPKSDTYNPITKTCQACNPKAPNYNSTTGLCVAPTCTPKSDTYNPFTKTCQACNPTVATYNSTTGLCTADSLCPDGSKIPPGGCPGSSNVCTTLSPTYNPVFKDCRECHPGVTGYNSTTGLCVITPPAQCEPTSPDYNPIRKDCRACHPGVAGYNETTGRCSIPGTRKVIDVIEA